MSTSEVLVQLGNFTKVALDIISNISTISGQSIALIAALYLSRDLSGTAISIIEALPSLLNTKKKEGEIEPKLSLNDMFLKARLFLADNGLRLCIYLSVITTGIAIKKFGGFIISKPVVEFLTMGKVQVA